MDSLIAVSGDSRFVVRRRDADLVLEDRHGVVRERVLQSGDWRVVSAEFSSDNKRLFASIDTNPKTGLPDKVLAMIFDAKDPDRSMKLWRYGTMRPEVLEAVWSSDSRFFYGRCADRWAVMPCAVSVLYGSSP